LISLFALDQTHSDNNVWLRHTSITNESEIHKMLKFLELTHIC